MYTEVGYVRKANQYIADVLSGKIPTCEYVKQACQRQADDLALEDFAYCFDLKKAEDVCFFIELLPHIEGPKAGTNIQLEPWQCFVLTTAFGWVHKETGKRRFRRVYIEIPKGNGKSALSSGVLAEMLLADGEGGAQVYSAATTRDQAKVVFGIAQKMLRLRPKVLARFGGQVNAHDITVESTSSSARTFSSDANSVEGCNPHFIVVDELHAHPSRQLYDNLETAMGKRDQDMLWAITTAGNDRSGICYEVRGYLLDILAGKKHDDSWFGVVYTIDKDDDWATEEALVKANPNWGVSFAASDRLQKLTKAMQLASAQPAFKTKHLNVWVNTAHSWMDMRKWDACADRLLTLDDMKELPCVLGLDLAARRDIAALAKLFWKEIDGQRHYYVFGTYWCPEETVEQSENAQYAGWADTNLLVSVPGPVNDYRLISQEMIETCRTQQVREVAHDAWMSDIIVADLVNDQLPAPMVKVAQVTKSFDPVMKEIEALVIAGRLHHDGNPVLAWAMSNVEVKPDHGGCIFPRKAKNQEKNKIDPAVALFIAMNRAMAQVGDGGFEVLGVI